jgi:hypothetical protein
MEYEEERARLDRSGADKTKATGGGFIIALQSTHSSLYITRTRSYSSLQAITQLGYPV